jgi:hypothetical protein
MRPKRAFLIAAILLAGPAVQSPASASMSLHRLLSAHTRARGGAKALDAVKSLRVDVHIEEPGLNAIGRWYGRVDGRMRVDIFSHSQCKRVYSEGIDDKGAWQWSGDAAAASDESAAGAAALRHGIEFNLFGLHRYEARGDKIRYMGLENVEGARLYALKITLADGFETYRFVDPATYMIVRSRDFRAYHPDMDPKKTWVETRYSDFRKHEEIVDSNASEEWNLAAGKAIGHSTTLRRDFNPVVTDEMLSRDAVPAPYC